MSAYIKPRDAVAPQGVVEIDRILIDGGEYDVSIARGAWDGVPRLLIRWNGGSENPKGFPAPRGHPAWHVIPDWMSRGVLESLAERMTKEISDGKRDRD